MYQRNFEKIIKVTMGKLVYWKYVNWNSLYMEIIVLENIVQSWKHIFFKYKKIKSSIWKIMYSYFKKFQDGIWGKVLEKCVLEKCV